MCAASRKFRVFTAPIRRIGARQPRRTADQLRRKFHRGSQNALRPSKKNVRRNCKRGKWPTISRFEERPKHPRSFGKPEDRHRKPLVHRSRLAANDYLLAL